MYWQKYYEYKASLQNKTQAKANKTLKPKMFPPFRATAEFVSWNGELFV